MTVRNAERRPPELLCPAGDEESLRAAVANGADAVYFGLGDFNARRRAANFSLEGLPELIRWLHHRNVRAYIAVNTLIFSNELERARQYVAGIAEAGADAVIVQDIGLMRLIRSMCPSLPIHASTQTTQTHPDGIAFLKALGVSRVILARELSLSQIEAIARATDVELEVFVHGAICISFSGQCLASEVLWGRSANRGLCAQACRLSYELTIDGQTLAQSERRYPLSPRDLAAADLVDRLVALGVAGLKIEGRLKSAAYVAAAARVYRDVLDRVLEGRSSKLTREQQLELTLSFSRGFTTGFLEGRHPGKLVDGRFPRSRGLLVGHVDSRTQRGIVVKLTDEAVRLAGEIARLTNEQRAGGGRVPAGGCPLSPGDGVVFDEGRPDIPEQGGRIYEVHPLPSRPARVEIAFGRDDLDIEAVVIGSRVWKTDDPGLRRKLERSARKLDVIRRAPLYARVEASPGQRLRLGFREVTFRSDSSKHGQHDGPGDKQRADATVESDDLLEAATRHPLTVNLLREQLGRLGDTPFELTGIELIGPGGPAESVPVMAPKSLLNELRRKAVEILLDARDQAARQAILRPCALEEIRDDLAKTHIDKADQIHCAVLVRTEQQLDAVMNLLDAQRERVGRRSPDGDATRNAGGMPLLLSLVYVDAAFIQVDATSTGFADALRTIRKAGCAAGVATPLVSMPGEEKLLEHIVAAAPDVVLVRSLAALQYLRQHAPGTVLIADHSLNATNEISAAVLAQAGVSRITPGYDLNLEQLAAMRSRAPGIGVELIVHAHVPMFHTAHCLVSAELGTGEDCGRCSAARVPAKQHSASRTPLTGPLPCRTAEFYLRDRNGQSHPLLVETTRRTTVFNAPVQSAMGLWPEILKLRPACVRIELLRESADQTQALLGLYGAVFADAVFPAEELRRLKRMCSAGVTTGTLAEARL